ncbi:MAG TPA: DUF1934 family protein [Bacillota bacterium]|nr:DUF1934 family protein [Bacillota bacterium]
MEKTVEFRMQIDGSIVSAFTGKGAQEGDRIIFSDDEGQTYRLQISDEEVRLYRTGKEELAILFRTGMHSGGILKTEGLEFEMNVFTRSITNKPTELVLEYDLIDDNEPVARHLLTAKWQ